MGGGKETYHKWGGSKDAFGDGGFTVCFSLPRVFHHPLPLSNIHPREGRHFHPALESSIAVEEAIDYGNLHRNVVSCLSVWKGMQNHSTIITLLSMSFLSSKE